MILVKTGEVTTLMIPWNKQHYLSMALLNYSKLKKKTYCLHFLTQASAYSFAYDHQTFCPNRSFVVAIHWCQPCASSSTRLSRETFCRQPLQITFPCILLPNFIAIMKPNPSLHVYIPSTYTALTNIYDVVRTVWSGLWSWLLPNILHSTFAMKLS